MRFDHRIPAAPPLNRSIRMLWSWRNPGVVHPMERLMPNGEAALIVNLHADRVRVIRPDTLALERNAPGAVLLGPHSTPSIVASGEQENVFGIQFLPGGAFAFFGVPAWELANAHVDLADLCGCEAAASFRAQLLEAASPEEQFDAAERFLLLKWRQGLGHPAVSYAIQAMDGLPRIRTRTLADRIGLSERRFTELFKRETGLPPKTFARVRRFQRVLERAHGLCPGNADWTRIAHESGYYDQPHFNHEFRELAGIAPTDYLRHSTRHPNHVAIPGVEFRDS